MPMCLCGASARLAKRPRGSSRLSAQNVTGVAQSAGERSGFPVIATEQIDEYLPTTDILVMVLPTSDSTFKALDAHKLQLLPKRAYLVNVGAVPLLMRMHSSPP